MKLDLDALKTEVLEHLESEGFVVFHGYSRLADTDSFVAWDTDRFPDYHRFVAAAKRAGVKLIIYHSREFTAAHLDEAADRLEESELSMDERRGIERRLKALKGYEGFTCALEISFDYESRVYLFSLRSDWYEDYLDLLEEIDAAIGDEDEEDDDSIGGYYSRN
jgi:hypothetical protein